MAQSANWNYPRIFQQNKENDRRKQDWSTEYRSHIRRKKIFTPKQWLERFRQYAKRKHKMDITELIRGAEMTQTGWSGKETEIQEDFIWGIGPDALYQMTRAENKTEPDKIAEKDLIRLFNEYFLPKRNTYHNRGEFFWTRQTESETPEDFWRRLIEIEK